LQGVGVGAIMRQDVDVRLRVGEALGQVIRRCGETLPQYCQHRFHPALCDRSKRPADAYFQLITSFLLCLY
jgi:hypothetical protein